MSESFHQFGPHLWVQQSSLFSTNSGVFLDGAQAALIDPGVLPEEIEETARFLAGRKARVELILLTHAHWDHILGVSAFPGARVIAQRNFMAETSGEAGERLRQRVERFYSEINRLPAGRFQLPIPDLTFSDAMTVTLGGEQLRLISSAGHASSQMAVYHNASGMLWAGDMLSDLEIPLLSQSLADYEQTLERFRGLEIRILVPGHGRATADLVEIQERLEADCAYVAGLHERVGRMVLEKRNPADALEACADMVFRHPEDNAGDHKTNIERAFQEMGGLPA